MKRSSILLAALAGAAFAAPAAAQRYDAYDDGYEEIVVCESVKKRMAYCEADTRDGVHLVDQLSKTRCVENENWGYDRGRIWVDQGCAARFGLGGKSRYGDARDRRDGAWRDDRRDQRNRDPRYDARRVEPAPMPYQGQGRITVICESKDNRRRYCPVDLRDRVVSVYANISTIPCDQKRNWDYDQGGIWVDGGCRAEFSVAAAGLLHPR